jgi:hypothetical protein
MSALLQFDEATSRRVEAMRKILAAWGEHLAHPYLPRRLTSLLTQAGFAVTHLTGLGADYFFSLNRYLFLAVK